MAKKAGMATGVEVARISVKVSPNTKEFRRELKSDLDAIEKSMKAQIEVEPDMGGFREKVNAKTKGMRAKVDVDANVDRKGFLGSIRNAIDSVGSKIQAPNFGSGINPAGYAVILAGIAAVAGPLVGLLTTALLAIPGLLAAVLAPIAAITVGLDGIKKAAGVLKAPFDQLKETMSAVNEKAFTPVFEKLRAIFPSLEKSMPAVSNGLATIGDSIADAVTSPESLARIESIFTNIGAALTKAAPGIGQFTDGLLKLVQQFTGTPLSGFSDWLSKTGKSFNDWITKLSRPSWFTGKSPLETMFEGLGSTLKVVADGLGEIATAGLDFMKDPKNLDNFKDALKGIATLLKDIVDLSTKINSWKPPEWTNIDPKKAGEGGLFNGSFPGMQQSDNPWLGGKVGKWLDEVETKVQEAFSNPKNFIGGGNGKDGTLGAVDWGSMMQLPDWGPLKDGWTQVETFFTDWWGRVKTGFSETWASVASSASGVWSTITSSASSAWASVQGAWSSAGSFLSGIWNTVASAASSAWNSVVGAVSRAWESVKSAVSNGINAVLGYVSSMGSRIYNAITSINLGAAGEAIMNGLLGGIKRGAEAVYNFVSSIANKIAALKGPLPYDRKVLIPNGEALMQGLGTGMESGLQDVLAQAKAMAEQISKAMNDGTDVTIDSKDLKRQIAALEQEKKRLKIQKDQTSDKDGKKTLQNQIDQLQNQKDLLAYQQDRVKNEKELAGASGEDPLVKAAAGLMKSPVDFAKATGQQFLSDIGISGNGLISKALTEGTKYIFQIGSVDEAMSIKDRTERKEALAVTGRQS